MPSGETPPIALVDCESFYVSCERVFDARLRKVPVVVLSNNDGCVISLSKDAKEAGIPMGAPYFKVRQELERIGARVLSSNYALYGDMSRRVMETLQTCAPDVEAYSIDEAWLRLPSVDPAELTALARQIQERVGQWTGIPVRVGIGPTKVLAKVAQRLAREHGETFSVTGHPDLDGLLEAVPVDKLWGIGRQYGPRLRGLGVHTARALRDVPLPWARRHLTVVGERLVLELRGVSCLPFEEAAPRHSLCCCRSFGEPVADPAVLRRALATFASRVAEKARRHGLVAAAISVLLTTRGWVTGPHQHSVVTATLSRATNYTPALIQAASMLLDRVWQNGPRYRKAGVTLLGLHPAQPEQTHLFEPTDDRQGTLMAAMDALNGRYGAGIVRMAAASRSLGHKREEGWQGRQAYRSPGYTTSWEGLMRVR